MKTLEDRLRDAGERFNHETDPTGSLWVALHDVLAIVADAPRIYRGEEIKAAPDGMYLDMSVRGREWLFTMSDSYKLRRGMCFGPLPTNSPSEGKE